MKTYISINDSHKKSEQRIFTLHSYIHISPALDEFKTTREYIKNKRKLIFYIQGLLYTNGETLYCMRIQNILFIFCTILYLMIQKISGALNYILTIRNVRSNKTYIYLYRILIIHKSPNCPQPCIPN